MNLTSRYHTVLNCLLFQAKNPTRNKIWPLTTYCTMHSLRLDNAAYDCLLVKRSNFIHWSQYLLWSFSHGISPLTTHRNKLIECFLCEWNTGLKWVKPFLHNVEKWSNILLKTCGVNTISFKLCFAICQHDVWKG